ncbi:MAG TPA: hypothetical protein DCL60_08385 [Armatimonadetes bacterium]|jgi:AraC-like DNA-binding protein|nr:hypothetical protein [Armatimonadota bacterium]
MLSDPLRRRVMQTVHDLDGCSIAKISPNIAFTGRMELNPGNASRLTPAIPDHDLQLVYRGTGIIVIDGNEIPIEKGDVVTVFPGESFYVKALGTVPFGRYFIHMDFFSQNDLVRTVTPRFANGSNWPRLVRLHNDVEARSLCADILLAKLKSNAVESCIFANGKLMSVLGLMLIQHRNAEQDDNPERLKSRRNILRAERYIVENYSNDMTIDELASIANLSPSYFTNLFKAILGKPPIEYLIDHRIAEAKRLMLETDCSISQVAHMVGYDDEHYFSYLFKRREGVSPSEFIAKCYHT